jgi:hypothetical protein
MDERDERDERDEEWSRRIGAIAESVGFTYVVSRFMEGRECGADIADIVAN